MKYWEQHGWEVGTHLFRSMTGFSQLEDTHVTSNQSSNRQKWVPTLLASWYEDAKHLTALGRILSSYWLGRVTCQIMVLHNNMNNIDPYLISIVPCIVT